MNKLYLYIFFIFIFASNTANSAPYSTTDNHMDFRTILGLSGTCFLDPSTENVISISGGLCPSSGMKQGRVAVHHIYVDPNEVVRIKVKSEIIPANSLTYTPAGFYTVSGFPDTPINPDSFTDIDSGVSGIIKITVGGTLSSTGSQTNSYTFYYIVREAIEWNVLP
jgi:hypothetical protein